MNAVSAVLVPESSGKPSASEGFKEVESFSLKHKRGVKLPPGRKSRLPSSLCPPPAVHPLVVRMPNGLTLIVQPESVSRVVSIFGHIRNKPEITEPAGKEGVSQVLDQLLSYGTTSLDRLAFQKALDDIGAVESAGDRFLFAGPCGVCGSGRVLAGGPFAESPACRKRHLRSSNSRSHPLSTPSFKARIILH